MYVFFEIKQYGTVEIALILCLFCCCFNHFDVYSFPQSFPFLLFHRVKDYTKIVDQQWSKFSEARVSVFEGPKYSKHLHQRNWILTFRPGVFKQNPSFITRYKVWTASGR